jgi:hypothetical protein
LTEPEQPMETTRVRGSLVMTVATVASIFLLSAILFTLVWLGRGGLTIHVTGSVSLANDSDQIQVNLTMDAPVVLSLEEPAQLVATGPGGEPIPASFSFAKCPTCGGTMLPSRWNPWNGEIEWTCPTCGGSATDAAGGG